MTTEEHVTSMLYMPDVLRWQADEGQKRRTLELALVSAIDRIANTYDFPFAVNTTTFTTDGSATYVLRGTNSDCRDIVSMRKGNTIIERRLPREMDDILSRQTPSKAQYWVLTGVEDGHPKVTLYDTPNSGDTIEYRYRRRNIPVSDFPNEWAYVLHLVALEIVESRSPDFIGLQVTRDAQRALLEMRMHYSRTLGYQRLPLDPDWRSRNITRNRKYGYR